MKRPRLPVAMIGLLLVGMLGFGVSQLPEAVAADDAVTPAEVLRPLEKKDLGSFTTWLKKTGREDPERVFRLEEGVLRCGDEDMGYVATREAYRDYHLSLEYRWGRRNPNDKYVRNSGVLLHGVGPDGSQSGVWMTSIECQLAQGGEGDLIVIAGKQADGKSYPATISCETKTAEDGKTRWSAGGKPVVYTGKQFWWSKHQPYFEELIDTRGANDVASPLGEWTKVECLCNGAKITIKINGVTVNECFDVQPRAGKILLQTEGHEVYFRNLEKGVGDSDPLFVIRDLPALEAARASLPALKAARAGRRLVAVGGGVFE